MFTKFRKEEKGFTLIELLIVVAIIGILAAIAIPQFSQYRQRGYVAAMKSDLKNGYTAAQAYLTDNPNVTWVAATGGAGVAALPGGAFRGSKANLMSGSMTITSGSFVISNASVSGATGSITSGGTITSVTGTAFN